MGENLSTLFSTWTHVNVAEALDALLGDVQQQLARRSYSFQHILYPRLAEIDRQIGGVGLHHVVWQRGFPWMPLAGDFEAVTNPLGQVALYLHLSDAPHLQLATPIALASITHLEQCVKRVPGARQIRSVAALTRDTEVRAHLSDDLRGAIRTTAKQIGNKVKHVPVDSKGQPPVGFDNAIRSYFVARALGGRVLHELGLLAEVVDTVKAGASTPRFAAQPGSRGDATVSPARVRVLPDFISWLNTLRPHAQVAVLAAAERLAEHGEDLLDWPGIKPLGRWCFLLEPEPGSLARSGGRSLRCGGRSSGVLPLGGVCICTGTYSGTGGSLSHLQRRFEYDNALTRPDGGVGAPLGRSYASGRVG